MKMMKMTKKIKYLFKTHKHDTAVGVFLSTENASIKHQKERYQLTKSVIRLGLILAGIDADKVLYLLDISRTMGRRAQDT